MIACLVWLHLSVRGTAGARSYQSAPIRLFPTPSLAPPTCVLHPSPTHSPPPPQAEEIGEACSQLAVKLPTCYTARPGAAVYQAIVSTAQQPELAIPETPSLKVGGRQRGVGGEGEPGSLAARRHCRNIWGAAVHFMCPSCCHCHPPAAAAGCAPVPAHAAQGAAVRGCGYHGGTGGIPGLAVRAQAPAGGGGRRQGRRGRHAGGVSASRLRVFLAGILLKFLHLYSACSRLLLVRCLLYCCLLPARPTSFHVHVSCPQHCDSVAARQAQEAARGRLAGAQHACMLDRSAGACVPLIA